METSDDSAIIAEQQQDAGAHSSDGQQHQLVHSSQEEPHGSLHPKRDTSHAASSHAGGGSSAAPGSLDQYHVVMSTALGVYTQWQSRVCYYWYKKVRLEAERQAEGPVAMGGFTRLLSGEALDGLEGEIPTVLVDNLPPELEAIAAGYVVLTRPYAFQQWARKALPSIPERYVFMAEPDHLFLRAPPLWATPTRPAAFPFFYIEPAKYPDIVAKFNAKNVSLDQMDPIGNSPVMIHRDQFTQIVDTWVDTSFKIKQDKEADTAWGWVQEMYGFSISSSQAAASPIRYDLHKELMLQPPWDASLKADNGLDAVIIHYTYGNDFNEQGEMTYGKVGSWHWDKRDYMDKYPPREVPPLPPGCNNEVVKELMRRVSEAAAALPDWDTHTGAKDAALAD